MAAYDVTVPAAIPTVINGTSTLPSTVTAIAGNVLTLSQNLQAAGVTIGDVILFAANRSQAVALSSRRADAQSGRHRRSNTRGQSILRCNVQSVFIDNITVTAGWNGVYIRGQSASPLRRLDFEGCLNIGLDIDNCANFSAIEDFRYWMWGWGPADPYGQARAALYNVYYDGNNIAANLGRCEGVGISNFQPWSGQTNLTANWTWGSFVNLMLDGNSSNLNITSASTANGWLQIGQLFKYRRPSRTIGHSIVVNPVNPGFHVEIENFALSSASLLYRGILLQNGSLSINNGYFWHGLGQAAALVQQSGGVLSLSNMRLDASAARTDTYIGVTGASSVIRISDCAFINAAGAGAVGVSVGTDNALNSIDNITWNGWGVVGTDGGLSFEGFVAPSNTSLARHISLHPSGYGFNVTASKINYTVPSGGHFWNVGGVEAFEVVAGGAYSMGLLAVGGTAGPTWTTGAAAPAGTQPKGSIYSRTGGAAGSTLYISQGGGTWLPVAGV